MAGERWRGTVELQQGKTEWDFTGAKVTITTSFTGPYATCLLSRPQIGDSIAGIGDSEGSTVTNAKVVELDGTTGRIDVTLESTRDDSGFTFEPLGDPVFETEFSELQRAIESHEACGILRPTRAKYKDGKIDADGKRRTWDDWSDLTDTPSSTDAGDEDYQVVGGGWSLAEYKSIKEKGQDSYIVFVPVVRTTTIHLARPAGVGEDSGKHQDPPGGANAPSGYDWLAGVDRCTKSKRTYTRVREWLGAPTKSGGGGWEGLVYYR